MTATTSRVREPVARPFPLGIFFLLDGILFATWAVRIPAERLTLGVSSTELGVALLCLSLGTLVSMVFTGMLVARYGTRPVTLVFTCAAALWMPVLALPGTVPPLAALLAVFGALYGADNIGLNSAAVEAEAATGRHLMPMLHGLWSIGCLIGSLLGGLTVDHLTTGQHFLLVAGLGAAVTAAAGGRLLRQPGRETASAPETGGKSPARRALQPAVAACGLVAVCTAFGEGASSDWSGIHLRDDLHSGAALAAYALAAYNLAIAAGRLVGGPLLTRIGPTAVLAGGGALAAGGMLLAARGGSIPGAFLGFTAVGLGLANVFPIAIARAGVLGGPSGIGFASGIGHAGMLGGPPLIGFLADRAGLPTALSTVAAAGALIALLALALRGRGAVPPTAAEAAPEAKGTPA